MLLLWSGQLAFCMSPVRFEESLSGRRSFMLQVCGVAFLYLLVQVIALSLAGGWQKFFVLNGESGFQYWDAIHYFNLGKVPGCSAFFPLWPLIISALQDVNLFFQGLEFQIILSEVIFLGSLPLALLVFRRLIGDNRIAILMLLLYSLGPNSIFFSIGYTESLFSLFSFLFLRAFLVCIEPSAFRLKAFSLLVLAFLSCLLNLTRPALVQTVFASLFCVCFVFLSGLNRTESFLRVRALCEPLGAILIGAIGGYSVYGFYCMKTAGDFWGPFHQQVAWGRTLAFRPWLMVTPRSLLIDLHGLYLPGLILLVLVMVMTAHRRGQAVITLGLPRHPAFFLTLVHPLLAVLIASSRRLRSAVNASVCNVNVSRALHCFRDPLFLYCLAFSGVHSAINFAANSGYLYSTSRHYFATPFAFVAIGIVLVALSWRYLEKALFGIGGVGVILLGVQWMNWSRNSWVG